VSSVGSEHDKNESNLECMGCTESNIVPSFSPVSVRFGRFSARGAHLSLNHDVALGQKLDGLERRSVRACGNT
jgi:hypothetical protein